MSAANARGKRRGENGRFRREWMTRELADLRKLAGKAPAHEIAEILGRSVKSVTRQAEHERISLRVAGETRGRAMGVPYVGPTSDVRRLELLVQLRRDVIAGRVDVSRLERRVRAINRGADLCPSCAIRPIEIANTGLCEVCNMRELARAHRLEAEQIEAQRELDAARALKYRANKRAKRGAA